MRRHMKNDRLVERFVALNVAVALAIGNSVDESDRFLFERTLVYIIHTSDNGRDVWCNKCSSRKKGNVTFIERIRIKSDSARSRSVPIKRSAWYSVGTMQTAGTPCCRESGWPRAE